MYNMWFLAQAAGQQDSGGITSEPVGESEAITTVALDPNLGRSRTRPQTQPWGQMLWLVAIFVIMYVILFRGPRRKQQQHKKMVKTLKKNDRVRTIGGIIGTVVDIKDDEIILKVDESNNTKIRVATSAIGKNMSLDKV